MSTADADDPALNGRLRPRKNSLGAGPGPTRAPAPVRPARRANDDKTKKPSTPTKKPPEKADNINQSLHYLRSLCPYCARKFGSRVSVSKHIARTHSSGSKTEPIECQFCKHAEVEAGDIVRHMVDSHPNQYFACLECHSRFVSTAELAVHKLHVCERQKPQSYRNKLRQKASGEGKSADFAANNEYATPDFNGIVISCELKPSQEHVTADIEDNITTNLILPPGKNSLVSTSMMEKNAVIVLDDIQWNKRMPPNFTFHNSDADQILSRLGVVHRSPRTSDNTRWYKHIEDTTKFERCFDTSFYSKVASNVQENLNKFLDGSFNRFQLDPENVIKTRRAKNSVVINTAEGFPILLAHEQYSRNMFDAYMPRAIAPKHKWKWDSIESDRNSLNTVQMKRDSHVNNCIITLVSSLDIWTQLCMRRKFEAKFNISSFNEKNTEKQNVIGNELKEILESRELPRREVASQPAELIQEPAASTSAGEFPCSLGLMRAVPQRTATPAVLSGEWVRPRCYVCCACGEKAQDSKQLSAHIASQHPVAQIAHYEVVGESLLAADIVKHLYVPPSQTLSRSRPLRGIRECTKCKKVTTLDELHQHMLECAGDVPVVRRKVRSRPFGVRRRRTRLPDEAVRKKSKGMRSRQRQKNHMRPRPRIRTEVGDAETIRKMIADLPAKRHRASVAAPNPLLRPRRNREQPRHKLLMKRRPSDEPKNKKQRTAGSPAPGKDAGPSKDPGPSGTQRNPTITKTRISRIATKVMRQSDVFKRKTLMRNAKRKARAIIEAASKENFDDPPPGASALKAPATVSLAGDSTPGRVDVNKGGGNPRGHAAREGNGSQDGRKSGGGGEAPAQNGQNDRPAQNTSLKHSIARLTAATETHDKSVQFQPHFLVQQECYKNIDRPFRPFEPQRLFENDIAAAKLDKPPLLDFGPSSADLQKNKANKPRKGLNDCIAMLKNKLVEPSSPSASAGHRSVQCDTADMPQYTAPPMPQLPEYITHPPAPAALSPPMSTIVPPTNPLLTPPSLSITPFNAVPSTATRSSRHRSPASPSVTVTRSSARSSSSARSRQRQSSVQRPEAATSSPVRAHSSDSRTTRRSPAKPQPVTMKTPPVQTMGPPCPVRTGSTGSAKSPVNYTPWALSKSPVSMQPPSPARSPAKSPQDLAKSPVSFTTSPLQALARERSPGFYSQPTREKSPPYYSQMACGYSVREKSPASYAPQAPAKSPVSFPPQASGTCMRDNTPGNHPLAAPSQPPLLYMPQSYAQSPATYPPRAPKNFPITFPPQAPSRSPVNYPAPVSGKSYANHPLQGVPKSPENFVAKPIPRSPVGYIQHAPEKQPSYCPARDPVAKSPVDFAHVDHAPPASEIPAPNYQPQAPAKSPVSVASRPPIKSPVNFTQTTTSENTANFTTTPVKAGSVAHLRTNSSPPVKEPPRVLPQPVNYTPPAAKMPLTVAPPTVAKSSAVSPPAPLIVPPPITQAVKPPMTISVVAPTADLPVSTTSPSAIKPSVSITSPGVMPPSLPAIPSMSNPRTADMHTENKYPLLEMNIPPAHSHTSVVSILSPLDLSGKSSGAISLVKSTYDDSYETLDLSNKSANSDNEVAKAVEPTDEAIKDDVVDLCIKKSTLPEVVETLDLSAKVHKNKKDTPKIVEHTEPVKPTEPLNQFPEVNEVQENQSKVDPFRDLDKNLLKPMSDQNLKIPQFKIMPTSPTCTTSDDKDQPGTPVGTKSAASSNTASDTKTCNNGAEPETYGLVTKDTESEDIINTPDTTMVAPRTTQMASSKETESKKAQENLAPIAASIAACSSALSATMSSQLATSLMNSLVSLPRPVDTAVTATTSTTCTTSSSDRRSEIVVPIGSVEDLEMAKKIAMLPKEILEILGKMPTDHRNKLLDVLPQYMVYNNAVKQLKLVVDISPGSLTSPIGIAKLASSKSEIATQTSNTSTEEVCPPEFLNVDTEKFLIDPFTGAITERAQQEPEIEKLENVEVLDISKDKEKVDLEPTNLPTDEALNLMAANKEISETVNTFTIPPVVKPNKPKEGSKKTASLRAVRIKTSERRMSLQNLNSINVKAAQRLPLVSNSVVPEKEELRAQLEVKTPPAIQQAEVSSTQQNGNRNISVDSTSPIAPKDMNVATQNKERRTSAGIDDHGPSNNSLSTEETLPKVPVDPTITEQKIQKATDDNEMKLTSVPETISSLPKKSTKKSPKKLFKKAAEAPTVVQHDTNSMDLLKTTPEDISVVETETAKLPDSDDSDDDISLAVILKKKKLDEKQPPKNCQDNKKSIKKGSDKKTKHAAKDIRNVIPPKENFENSAHKSQNAMKDLTIEGTANKIQSIIEVDSETDEVIAETKNHEPVVKKKKGRRRVGNKQNNKRPLAVEDTGTNELIINKTTYHDKENNDETLKAGNKFEKINSNSGLTKVDTRINHGTPVCNEMESAKPDHIAETDTLFDKTDKIAPADDNLNKDISNTKADIHGCTYAEETRENISISQTTEPKITDKKSNIGKKSKKRKKYDLEETATLASGTINSDIAVEPGERVITEERTLAEVFTTPSAAKSGETLKVEESNVKFAETPNVSFDESLSVEEDLLKTKLGRAKRSNAKDSPKTVASDDLALSICSDDGLKPLRRSRRGKSIHVDTPILDTPESLPDIYIENKAPLTKKQLIFSKLLLDEENNARMSTISVDKPQAAQVEETDSVVNHIEEPISTKKDRSGYTPDVAIDETIFAAEPLPEKRKSSKRKKSPHFKQHSKRKRSYEKDQYECILLHTEIPSKEFREEPTQKLQLEASTEAPEIKAKIDITGDDDEIPKHELSKEKVLEQVTLATVETEKHEIDEDHEVTTEDYAKTKETKGKSKKSKHSTEKRKSEQTVNVSATSRPKMRKTTKHVEGVEEITVYEKPAGIEHSIKDTTVRRNEPTKMTTCYDMPRAAARTRAKSLLIKSFMDEIYDPYDIDLEDKLLQDIELISKKTHPVKDKPKETIYKKTRPVQDEPEDPILKKNHPVQEKPKELISKMPLNEEPEEPISKKNKPIQDKLKEPISKKTRPIQDELKEHLFLDDNVEREGSQKTQPDQVKPKELVSKKTRTKQDELEEPLPKKIQPVQDKQKELISEKTLPVQDEPEECISKKTQSEQDKPKETISKKTLPIQEEPEESISKKTQPGQDKPKEPISNKTRLVQDESEELIPKGTEVLEKPEHVDKLISKKTVKKNKKKSRHSNSSDGLNQTVTSSQQAITSNGKDNSSDSDSSKSDVPLKKYADENAKANKKSVKADDTATPQPEAGHSEKPVNKRKTGAKRKRKVEEVVEDQEQSPDKKIEDAEELRSEQFMESFGFFSERKPRKSNLLASKKISETFHIIANENDDFYFRNKEKAAKRGDRRKSTSVTHTYDLECNARGIAHCHARRGRRGRRKRVPNPLTYCEICRKEFRRPDNYLRHQMTLSHISRLSAKVLESDADSLPDIPNYLVIYRQHLERLRRLTGKLQRKNKKLGLDPSQIKIPTIQDIIADAKIHQYNMQKSNARRGLSRDEALFLHCCELLKSNQNDLSYSSYSRVSATVTSRSIPVTSTIVMPATSTVTSGALTTKSNDGDVDSITAKTIMESEEVRNLENDLISGIKEAVTQNLAASAAGNRNYDYDTGVDPTSDLDAHDLDLDSAIPELESRAEQHRQSSGDELIDKLSSPKTNDSPFEEIDSAEEPARVRKPRRSTAKLSEMLDIDLFEDKFDKIKRKCRSQAAAAKNTQPAEPVASTSGTSYKVKKKAERKKTKKNPKNQSMIMTKGALKGFDGFKVSIPTSDINMSAIVSGLGETPRKQKKGNGKNRREKPGSGKYESEQVGPYGSSSGRSYDNPQPGPSGTQGNLDVYEFLDNDDADLFPSAMKDRYKTFKPTSRAEPFGKRDDDSASGSDGDDFVYMSDDYPCSADETENSVMSCELPKGGLEPKKFALKRKDAVEKNAVMGKIFKNNAVRTDKKSSKGKEPAKSPKANLDQLFDSLLEEEPAAACDPAEPGPSGLCSQMRGKGRATPVPNSDSDSEPFGAESPVPAFPLRPSHPPPDRAGMSPEPRHFETRKVSPEAPRPEARRWMPSSLMSPSSTLEDPQPGTSRDSLPYDLSDSEPDGGVARHRARRKCTVGKQNVLTESWSSESEPDGGTARANSTESILASPGRKKKGKKGGGSQQPPKRVRHVTFKKQESAPAAGSSGAGGVEGGGRAASTAYTWAPDESGAPHAPQHGWIVGNSHKKLVTMLAHAKGRRREDKCGLDE